MLYGIFANAAILIEQALTSRWSTEKLGKCFQLIRTHEKYCFNHSFDTFSHNTLRCCSVSSSYLACFMHGQRISHVASYFKVGEDFYIGT